MCPIRYRALVQVFGMKSRIHWARHMSGYGVYQMG
jgi:hypothetical protein